MKPARIRQKLFALLKNSARIAVLGIGSELRADDFAGLLALKTLKELLRGRKGHDRSAAAGCNGPKTIVKLFNGGNAPENLTGVIRRFNPAALVVIDAVELGKKAGAIALVDLRRAAGVFLTHKLPVKLMLDFLSAEMNFKTVFIGIQPKSLKLGAPVANEVAKAARQVGAILQEVFSASRSGHSCPAGRKKSSRPRPQAEQQL